MVGTVAAHYLRPPNATAAAIGRGLGPGFTLGLSAGFGTGADRSDVIEGEAYEP